MKYKLMHYYGRDIDIPGAMPCDIPNVCEIEIENILDFVSKYGPVIISPPGKNPYPEGWFIWITDQTGRFVQK